jgi:hypothetical protein
MLGSQCQAFCAESGTGLSVPGSQYQALSPGHGTRLQPVAQAASLQRLQRLKSVGVVSMKQNMLARIWCHKSVRIQLLNETYLIRLPLVHTLRARPMTSRENSQGPGHT